MMQWNEKEAIKEALIELKDMLYNDWCSLSFCKYLMEQIDKFAESKGINLND